MYLSCFLCELHLLMIVTWSYLCYDCAKILISQLQFIWCIYQTVISIQLSQSPVYLLICLAIFGIAPWITILKYFNAQIVIHLACKSSFQLAPVSLWHNPTVFFSFEYFLFKLSGLTSNLWTGHFLWPYTRITQFHEVIKSRTIGFINFLL